MNPWKYFSALFSLLVLQLNIFCIQTHAERLLPNTEIQNLIQSFKVDERGPYQAIRWFCPDGSQIPANQRCNQPGGIQHALPKDKVQYLAKEYRLYLGQILAGTPFEEFWDESNRQSRLKQYILEKYLRDADDGWILRKARYYRGAIQAEDEEQWGIDFLKTIISRDNIVKSHFFLLKQAFKSIPHYAGENRWPEIRGMAKFIADAYPEFNALRVKIHGHADQSDIDRVRNFGNRHKQKMSTEINQHIDLLIKKMENEYALIDFNDFRKRISRLSPKLAVRSDLDKFFTKYASSLNKIGNSESVSRSICTDLSVIMWDIRKTILMPLTSNERLALMDLSNDLESIFFRESAMWTPDTLSGLSQKCYTLAKAAAACGFIEIWEWEAVDSIVKNNLNNSHITIADFLEKTDYAVRIVFWGTEMVRIVFEPETSLFQNFEPLSKGFIDDRIRSSPLLALGETAWQMSEISAGHTKSKTNVMGIKKNPGLRGLNPGYAFGELQVIESLNDLDFDEGKIYALSHAPSEMKPVAGILTVSEGNLVSHVQLLARNLGIPNTIIPMETFQALKAFSGQRVFYAVSPMGTVLIEPETGMTPSEKELTLSRKKSETKIAIPVDTINLKKTSLVSLKNLKISDSGHICGPKAANLGRLKSLFPENVVEGLVIPFAVFRQHMDQKMPGTGDSYWKFLTDTFVTLQTVSETNEMEINSDILKRLERLRQSLKEIPLHKDFLVQLESAFPRELGNDLGKVPVFIRSDTNMEDLKDFTGAGLNLTVFNVVSEKSILQAIRDVWTSIYSERSYKWRQKYLLNPENVFPSILILPSVNVEKSGVMITTGVNSGRSNDITIAFSRGVGGAVEGQAAESYLIYKNGTSRLLTPSRDLTYKTLPGTGGVESRGTFPVHRILNENELDQLFTLGNQIRERFDTLDTNKKKGPLDVELGFMDGKIWLFQVRPFVENKLAKSSTYLRGLDPEIPGNLALDLNEKLNR